MMSNPCVYSSIRCNRLRLLRLIILAAFVLTSGCHNPAQTHKSDISKIKITDFSQLETPGEGFSAVFVVVSYEVPMLKFAPIRIFAEQLKRLPSGNELEIFAKDGYFCGLGTISDFKQLDEAIEQSNAIKQRTLTFLFYDDRSEYLWFEPVDNSMLIYNDINNMPKSLNLDNGRLGVSVSILPDVDRYPAVIAVPVFQERHTIPEKFLKAADKPIFAGRTVIKSLAVSSRMQTGDFLFLTPDMIPLDAMTFSKYAFSGKEDDTFRIYCIFCRSMTSE